MRHCKQCGKKLGWKLDGLNIVIEGERRYQYSGDWFCNDDCLEENEYGKKEIRECVICDKQFETRKLKYDQTCSEECYKKYKEKDRRKRIGILKRKIRLKKTIVHILEPHLYEEEILTELVENGYSPYTGNSLGKYFKLDVLK